MAVAANPSTEIGHASETPRRYSSRWRNSLRHLRPPDVLPWTRLDIQALIDRFGPDHGSMHQDLVSLFVCSACEAAGRDRRPVFFTCIPDNEHHQQACMKDWKRRSSRGKKMAGALGERLPERRRPDGRNNRSLRVYSDSRFLTCRRAGSGSVLKMAQSKFGLAPRFIRRRSST